MSRLSPSYRISLAILCLGIAHAQSSISLRACTVCIGFPERTVTDHLLDANTILLARPDEQDPYKYAPCEILKGSLGATEIDLLLDTATQIRLKADGGRHVVLVQKAQGGPWRSLGVASPAFESVIRRILLLAPNWRTKDGSEQRARFFLSLFGHADRSVHELAYLELGRAPYSMIQQLGTVVCMDDVLPMLSDIKYIEWQSLAILLLAQSEAPEHKQYILRNFRNAHQFRLTTNLAAWTAAAIEVDPDQTLDFVAVNYFRAPDRTPEELADVTKAFSMHGVEGGFQMRDRIVEGYGELLRSSVLLQIESDCERVPGLLTRVATDLLTWQRTEHSEELSRLERTCTSLAPSDRELIRSYLRFAASRDQKHDGLANE